VTKQVTWVPQDATHPIVLMQGSTLHLLGNTNRTITVKTICQYCWDPIGQFWTEESYTDTTQSTGSAGGGGPPGPPGPQGPAGPGYQATSTTSLAIGTGAKTLTTQSGLAYSIGARARISSSSAPTNWMEGQVTGYSGTTLTITADLTNGSGSFAAWTINLAGVEGATGPQGLQGATGPTGATGAAGPPGPTGPQGAPGPTGATGATGPQGPKGDKGDTGATGAQGPQGNPGATGATGPGYTATSTTSVVIGTGSKTFTTQSGLAYSVGARVRTTSNGAPTNWMEGQVTAYGGTTLTLNVDLTNGGGAFSDWNINLAGQQGVQGATGATGPQGSTGATGAQGPQGNTGPAGPTGATGPAGPGVPTGGTTGQVLAKTSSADYATAWTTSSGGGIPDAPSDSTTYGRLNATWTQVLPLTGGTLTGGLTITLPSGVGNQLVINGVAAQTFIYQNRPAGAYNNNFVGQVGGLNRWNLILGNSATESGSNAGSDFSINRYSDAGTIIDAPLTISRANGSISLTSSGGGLNISPPTPASGSNHVTVNLSSRDTNLAANGAGNYIYGWRNGQVRWLMQVGDGAAESGGNGGSNLAIHRYSDAGAYLAQSLSFTRAGTIFVNDAVQYLNTAAFTIAPSTGAGGLAIYKNAGANQVAILSVLQGAGMRWSLVLGDSGTESGGNVGSGFQVQRFADNGAYLDSPIQINRANAATTLTGAITLNTQSGVNPQFTINSNATGTNFQLNRPSGTYNNNFQGLVGGLARWNLILGNSAAESGSNAGSDCFLTRYSDAGAAIDQPISVSRQTGLVSLTGHPAGYAMPGQLSGLTMSVNGGNAFCLDVAPGGATSDDNTTPMLLAATWTKNLTAVFGAGNGTTFGGMDTGSVAANTWYHVWLILNPTGNVADLLFSLSATAPTLPAGYTKKRRIGSIKTNASSQITPFSQYGDQFLLGTTTAWNEYNGAGLATSLSLTGLQFVPSGVKVEAILHLVCTNASSCNVLLMSPDSAVTGFGAWTIQVPPGSFGGGQHHIRTNTSAQFLIGATVAGTALYCTTMGWFDNRGK
jgi:hypothetical protein